MRRPLIGSYGTKESAFLEDTDSLSRSGLMVHGKIERFLWIEIEP